jgi:hypothetical protein
MNRIGVSTHGIAFSVKKTPFSGSGTGNAIAGTRLSKR